MPDRASPNATAIHGTGSALRGTVLVGSKGGPATIREIEFGRL